MQIAEIESFMLIYYCVYVGFRVVTLAFEQKKDDKKKNVLEIAKTCYEAMINKKKLDNEKFDQNVLELGKKLVLDWTLDVVV